MSLYARCLITRGFAYKRLCVKKLNIPLKEALTSTGLILTNVCFVISLSGASSGEVDGSRSSFRSRLHNAERCVSRLVIITISVVEESLTCLSISCSSKQNSTDFLMLFPTFEYLTDAFVLLVSFRWAFGILVWEIVTFGKLIKLIHKTTKYSGQMG